MAIGGFDNEGGNLTLSQFKQYVARGEIHYYIAGGGAGSGSGAAPSGFGAGPSGAPSGSGTRPSGAPTGFRGSAASGPGGAGGSGGEITSWVKSHYKPVTIGGQTVYDLTQPVT